MLCGGVYGARTGTHSFGELDFATNAARLQPCLLQPRAFAPFLRVMPPLCTYRHTQCLKTRRTCSARPLSPR